jgi:hypothetical protein
MRAVRIRGALGCGLIVVLGVSASACASGSSKSASPGGSATTTAPTSTVPNDSWTRLLRQVNADGTVSLPTALSAFALAIGPVPGGTVPAGPRPASLESGSLAVDWVFAHWSELTPAQRRTVFADLGAQPVDPNELTAAGNGPSNGVQLAKAVISPAIKCPAESSSSAGSYVAQVPKLVSELASHLGTPLHAKVYVIFNSAPSKEPGEDSIMYTYGCSGTSIATGAVNNCAIHLTVLVTHYSDHDQTSFLTHELEHCFLFAAVGAATYSMPAWYVEGSATWAEATLSGGDTIAVDNWKEYVNNSLITLLKRTYDALGFFAHMQETGIDTWHALMPMARALVKSGNAPGAAWDAAGVSVNQTFLDNWGAGFVQGDYPGTPWLTTMPGMPRGVANLDEVSLNNGQTLKITALPAAAASDRVDVHADVVQFTGLANGRVSLGGGKDVTLEAARADPYCTLPADKCKCPADSIHANTVFRHMDRGTEYLGATGGLADTAAAMAGESLADYCGKACIEGSWEVKNEVVGIGNASGGAGTRWNIGSDHLVTVRYDGTEPLVNPALGLSIKYAGEETDRIVDLTEDTNDSGTWTVKVVSGGVRAKTTVFGRTTDRNVGFDPGYQASGTWICHGNAMTASFAPTRETVTLERLG